MVVGCFTFREINDFGAGFMELEAEIVIFHEQKITRIEPPHFFINGPTHHEISAGDEINFLYFGMVKIPHKIMVQARFESGPFLEEGALDDEIEKSHVTTAGRLRFSVKIAKPRSDQPDIGMGFQMIEEGLHGVRFHKHVRI